MANIAILSLLMMLLVMFDVTGTQIYRVGDYFGWNNSTKVDYSKWSASKDFQVGDVLMFQFDPNENNVFRVSPEDFATCRAPSPIGLPSDGQEFYPLDRPGRWYFVCSIPGRCESGQKLEVLVHPLAAPAPPSQPSSPPPSINPPSMAPPPTPSQSSQSAPPQNNSPSQPSLPPPSTNPLAMAPTPTPSQSNQPAQPQNNPAVGLPHNESPPSGKLNPNQSPSSSSPAAGSPHKESLSSSNLSPNQSPSNSSPAAGSPHNEPPSSGKLSPDQSPANSPINDNSGSVVVPVKFWVAMAAVAFSLFPIARRNY